MRDRASGDGERPVLRKEAWTVSGVSVGEPVRELVSSCLESSRPRLINSSRGEISGVNSPGVWRCRKDGGEGFRDMEVSDRSCRS